MSKRPTSPPPPAITADAIWEALCAEYTGQGYCKVSEVYDNEAVANDAGIAHLSWFTRRDYIRHVIAAADAQTLPSGELPQISIKGHWFSLDTTQHQRNNA